MKKDAVKQSKDNSLFQKLLTVIGITMCIILAPILVINCFLVARSYITGEVPNLGANVPLIVLSNSMYPTIETGDMIICRQTDADEIEAGDVIAFFDPAGNGTTIVTHRVMSVGEEDGQTAWITKGDNNNSEDRLMVTEDLLVAEWNGIRIPHLGRIAIFMQTAPGLVLCVILPIVLLIGYDIIRRKMYETSSKKDTDALLRELEELRRLKASVDASKEEK